MKIKNKSISFLLIPVLLITFVPAFAITASAATDSENDERYNPIAHFTDVNPSDWFFEAVFFVWSNNFMQGTSGARFSPNAPLTRGMVVTVLYRTYSETESAVEAGNPFTDVRDGAWYADAVTWAYHNNIVTGITSSTFAPNANITREQLATILHRYAVFSGIDVSIGEDTNILSYQDAFDISEWAMAAMQWAAGAGVITGRTADLLVPQGEATRAEFATVLFRLLDAAE